MDAVVCGHKSYNGIRDESLGCKIVEGVRYPPAARQQQSTASTCIPEAFMLSDYKGCTCFTRRLAACTSTVLIKLIASDLVPIGIDVDMLA